MRLASLALLITTAATVAQAELDTIVVPEGNFGNYDPTLSAREAVLANWELAASGLRAGEVIGGKIVDMADDGAEYGALVRQAAFAQKTVLGRAQAASWAYMAAPDMARLHDDTMLAIVDATTTTECASQDCAAETAALRAAFAKGAEELAAASAGTRALITERQSETDAVIMAEQLGLMADYLDSGAWAEDLVLTEYGMDVDMVADRIVGTMALWNNIEPYVGLTDQTVDDAINAASQTLLRTLRRQTRDVEVLDPESAVMTDLSTAASALATELRRAALLFSS